MLFRLGVAIELRAEVPQLHVKSGILRLQTGCDLERLHGVVIALKSQKATRSDTVGLSNLRSRRDSTIGILQCLADLAKLHVA